MAFELQGEENYARSKTGQRTGPLISFRTGN